MPTVKAILDTRAKSKSKAGTYPVVVRIRHQLKQRQIPTHYKIDPQYWTGTEVIKKHPDHKIINSILANTLHQAKAYFAECHLSGRPIRIELIGAKRQSFSVIEYLQHRAEQYAKKEMIIMKRKATQLANDLSNCFKRDIYFDDLTHDFLRDFESYLVQKGNSNNTRNKKYKFLQEFYGQAVADGKAELPNHVKTYRIPKKPVKKEKLTLQEIKRLEELPLKPGTTNNARNLFLFAYYCKGVRFENCVTAKRSDLVNDRIQFKTNKGNKYITVKIHTRLQAILDQYNGEYLFPYVTDLPEDKTQYIGMVGSLNTVVNRQLKALARLSGINKSLTFHISRHSVAYHLMSGSSIHTIKEVLGHSDTRTTEIYLKELGDEAIDVDMAKLYGE